MNAFLPRLAALGLASFLVACTAPPPPPPSPPSDEQPIKAAPSTPVERQAEPTLPPPQAQDDKDKAPQSH